MRVNEILQYLKQRTFTDKQFVQITEEFGLKHGVELINTSDICEKAFSQRLDVRRTCLLTLNILSSTILVELSTASRIQYWTWNSSHALFSPVHCRHCTSDGDAYGVDFTLTVQFSDIN
jgi:hypothetical protein